MHRDQGATTLSPPLGRTPERRRPLPDALREDTLASDPAGAPQGPTRQAGPLARIEAMGAEECVRAYRAGRLTRAERTAWAAVYPEEVPMVNDEFEWIGLLAE